MQSGCIARRAANRGVLLTAIPDEIRNSLEAQKGIENPDMHRLRQADNLIADPVNDLTELSNDECIDFALIEALHKGGIINLSGTMAFLELLKRNRASLDRKRVDEYLKAVVGQTQPLPTAYSQIGAPGSFTEIDKPSIFKRFGDWLKS